MQLHFFLKFHTEYGQSLLVCGNTTALGDNDLQAAAPMRYHSDQWWYFNINLEGDLISWPDKLIYHYVLQDKDGQRIREWGDDRILEIDKIAGEEVRLLDTWNHAGHVENVFFNSPFQDILIGEQRSPARSKPYRGNTHIFKVKAPVLNKGEVLCICGGAEGLGNWETSRAIIMSKEGNWWTTKVNLTDAVFPLEYKYGVLDVRTKKFQSYENGSNRILTESAQAKKVVILHDGFAQLSWKAWKGAGVAIPVFSLRTNKSFGVGEFTDIKALADWAKSIHLKLIQILPVNDTTATHTWEDSYPYKGISAFALHPIYINLEQVAGKDHKLIKQLRKKQQSLNSLSEVDYQQVMKFKWDALKELYKESGNTTLASEGFRDFYLANEHWLTGYAAFSYLREKYKTADYNLWKSNSVYDPKNIQKLVAPTQKHYDEIALYYFIQYHLHLQLREAVEYAHKAGIIIKGDIPIGINRTGVDAWMQPELFNMDMQAGAPPDDFAVKGQNWGFPTYNWQRMQQDGFLWWKQRFEHMSRYFDAFRIDHILGFFRIWSIPQDSVDGIMGHFVPSIPVHVNEFSERGIRFDYNRFCQPFISDSLLWEMFGPLNEKVRAFLESSGEGMYRLRDEFKTQRQVEIHFASLPDTEENERVRNGLYDLLSNVILFEVKDSNGSQYHMRISMEQTSSFRQLDGDTQQKLKDLFINYFFRRQDAAWAKEAMQKLPELKRATNMLICGEDLGMVPDCVPDVMKQLGILSLEIQRMPKDPKREFFHPNDAPYLSVVTPSTHDMSTLRGWWEEDRNVTQKFYNHELGQYGQAPQFCEAWINEAIVIQHLYSPAMWSIFQLQDLMGMDENLRRENPQEERINVPANPRHYWRYRMHLSLEDLKKKKDFNSKLKQYIESSGRD